MTLLSLLGFLAPCPCTHAASPSYEIALPILAVSPSLNGRQGKDEWRGAVSLFGFRDLRTGQLCAPQPQVWLARDAEALYLAARVPKPAGVRPKYAATQHDGPLWDDDAIELFIAPRPGDGGYYQFIVNPAGVTWESSGRDAAFSGAWEAKTDLWEDAWTAELRVPFASLGVAAPGEGDVWAVNVGWDRQTPSPAILTWAPVKSGFHEPDAFRRVAFLASAVPFAITDVSDPQSGRLQLQGLGHAAREARASLTVSRLEGQTRTGIASAETEVGDRFVLGADLPAKDGAPAAGEYEAHLTVTAGALTSIDLSVPFAIRPKLEIVLRKYVLREGQVIAQITAPGLQLPPGEGQLRVQLLTAAGEMAQEQAVPLPAEGEATEVAFGTQGLKTGAHEVRVVATDPQGAEVGAASATFELPEQPPWLGSQEGITDQILAPWTPVRARGQTVSVWGRTYEFAGMPLPSAIRAADASILAGPIRFLATVGGVEQQWGTSKASIAERKPAAATVHTEATSDDLRIDGTVRVEYDGMLRSDFEVEPLGEGTLDSLVLEIPLKAEHAKYLYHYPGRWGSAYNAGALPEEGFEAAFRPFVWLGDEDRGLAWFSESDRGFTPLDAKDVVSIRREGDQVVLRIKVIGEPVTLDKPLEYTFGMQATPVKPMQPDVWDYRICHHGSYGIQDQTVSFSPPTIYPAAGSIDLRQGTFEAWVRPQFDPNPDVAPDDPGRGKFNRSLFDVVLPGDSRIGFYWNIDDRGMRAYYKRGSEYPLLLTSSPAWQQGEWHHVALTWGEETAIWIDGKKVASRAYQGTLDQPLEGATVQLGLTACEFDVDEMRISDVPRPEFDPTQPPALDDHTLLLDRFDDDFTPDGKQATRPVKGSPGVPGAGTAFVEGRFGRALTLHNAGRPTSLLDRLAELGVRTICFHEHWTDIQDYATTTRQAELKKLVAACHALL